jgi:hypothetical protein
VTKIWQIASTPLKVKKVQDGSDAVVQWSAQSVTDPPLVYFAMRLSTPACLASRRAVYPLNPSGHGSATVTVTVVDVAVTVVLAVAAAVTVVGGSGAVVPSRWNCASAVVVPGCEVPSAPLSVQGGQSDGQNTSTYVRYEESSLQ